MIKSQKLVPQVLVRESRDYQLLLRLFDAVINSSKTYTDLIKGLPLSANVDSSKLLDLVALTVGFESKHSYDLTSLYYLCTAFKKLLRYKGTRVALEEIVNIALRAQNISKNAEIEIITDRLSESNEGPSLYRYYQVNLYVPYELTNTTLLEDLLDYVLPSGFLYRIIPVEMPDNSKISDNNVHLKFDVDKLNVCKTLAKSRSKLASISTAVVSNK